MVQGILEVHLMDANGLAKTHLLGKTDPYVLIQYASQERRSSTARGQGRNPHWNETFKFVVNSPVIDSHHHHKLILRIFDHDTFTKDDYLGEATINVADVIALGLEKGTEELHLTKYRVVLADGSYSGEIRVAVTFTTKMEEMNEEEYGGYKHSFFS